MKLTDAPDGTIIGHYIKLRDERAALKAERDAALAEIDAKLTKLEMEQLRRLNERDVDSVSARGIGTAYRNTRTSCTVADRDAFFNQFVIPNQAYDFLESRANKTAVAAYKDEHGAMPPGLKWTEITGVNFQRS